MKVLLTRPLNKTPVIIPAIGLGYLAAALRKAGHDVEIVDCLRERKGPQAFSEFLRNHRFEAIGFQVYTFDVECVSPYLKAAREVSPNAFIVAGGPHPSAEPAEMLARFPELDAVFCGEAEPGFPVFCSRLTRYSQGRNGRQRFEDDPAVVSDIPGLVYRGGEGIVRNSQAVVEDLNSTGFPAWDLLRPEACRVAPHGAFTRRLPAAPIIATRGCPFDCAFCSGTFMSGKRVRARSPKNVVDEIEFLHDQHGIQEIHIEDDNFSLHRSFVQEFCQELLRRQIDIVWACPNGLRLDSLDKGLVQLMERSGCYSFAVGIESGNQRTLDRIGKRLKVGEVKDKIEMIRRNSRIRITGFFILGYPGETVEEINNTIRFALDLDLDKANFAAFMPLPGSRIYRELREKGLLDGLDFSRISELRVPFSSQEVGARRLRYLLRWAYFRFYGRPHIILRFLRDIRSFSQARVLFDRLRDFAASFYEGRSR